MSTKSCSITISSEPRNYPSVSLSYVCAVCTCDGSVMIELAKDGIELSRLRRGLTRSHWWHCSPVLVPTGGGKVSISCDCCEHEIAECRISKNGDGIFFTLENFGNTSGNSVLSSSCADSPLASTMEEYLKGGSL